MSIRQTRNRQQHLKNKVSGTRWLGPAPGSSNLVKIFPFTFLLGTLNSTETGYQYSYVIPNDFSTFSRIFTGREAVVASWDNATDLIENPDDPNDKKYKFQVGTWFEAELVNDSLQTSFAPSSANATFLSQQLTKTFSIKLWNNYGVNEEFVKHFVSNQWKLYKSPKLNAEYNDDEEIISDQQWYYIESCTPARPNNANKIEYFDIKLVSLNDRLANSGVAVNQYVQLGFPGMNYALPFEDEYGNVSINGIYTTIRPVTHVGITINGSIADFAVKCWGRDLDISADSKTKNEYKLYPSKMLFPYKYQAGVFDPVNSKANAENVYVVTKSTVLSMLNQSSYLTFLKNLFITPTKEINYEGTWLMDRNSKNGNKNNYPFWHSLFLSDDDWQNTNYDTRSNPWFSRNIKNNVGSTVGTANFNYSNVPKANKNYPNYNMLTSLLYDSVLDITTQQNTILKFSTSIGNAFWGWTVGYKYGLNPALRVISDNTFIPTFPYNNFLMSKELLQYYDNIFPVQTSGDPGIQIPFDAFRNDTTDEIQAFLGSQSYSNSKVFTLTDRISLVENNLTTLDKNLVTKGTEFIGQLNQNDPNIVNLIDPASSNLLEPDFTDENVGKWCIDIIDIKIAGKADIKITFYSQTDDINGPLNEKNAIWTGTYQSIGKFTSNSRTIQNQFILGNEKLKPDEPFRWPAMITPPNPTIFKQRIDLNYQDAYFNVEYDSTKLPVTKYLNVENYRYYNVFAFEEQKTAPNVSTLKIINLSDYGYSSFEELKTNYKNFYFEIEVQNLNCFQQQIYASPVSSIDYKMFTQSYQNIWTKTIDLSLVKTYSSVTTLDKPISATSKIYQDFNSDPAIKQWPLRWHMQNQTVPPSEVQINNFRANLWCIYNRALKENDDKYLIRTILPSYYYDLPGITSSKLISNNNVVGSDPENNWDGYYMHNVATLTYGLLYNQANNQLIFRTDALAALVMPNLDTFKNRSFDTNSLTSIKYKINKISIVPK